MVDLAQPHLPQVAGGGAGAERRQLARGPLCHLCLEHAAGRWDGICYESRLMLCSNSAHQLLPKLQDAAESLNNVCCRHCRRTHAGRKRWALYPPGRVPPGVLVNIDADGSPFFEVQSSSCLVTLCGWSRCPSTSPLWLPGDWRLPPA